MRANPNESGTRILSRVAREGFIGRTAELRKLLEQTAIDKGERGMLVLMAPSAGVSELLRQSFDQIFNLHSDVIPIYFAFTRNETTAVSAAIEFLNAFLHQYIAFRRNEPSLCYASLTLEDLVDLAPPADLPWIQQLVTSYGRLRFSNDDRALVRFCLGAPQRVPAVRGRPFVMLDGAQLAEYINGVVLLGTEVMRVFARGGFPFVVAGMRRQILSAVHQANVDFEKLDILRLEQLEADQASLLVEQVASRQRVAISTEVRDLLVQQFTGSPFFISTFLQAARERNVALISYLDCERLYVDELLGGHLHRHFGDLLEEAAPRLETRQGLVRLLWEAIASQDQASSFETWRRQLRIDAEELEDILHRLHVQEFINWNEGTIEAGSGPLAWNDYLKVRYRLDVNSESRALVAADALTDSLKRAPHTMARHYRRMGRLDLRHLLKRFDCQRIPAVLVDNGRFNQKYRGLNAEQLPAVLEKETETLRLPQTVHVASCVAFESDMRQVCEDDRCVIAHTFEDAVYNDANEIIWLVAEIESKLEVSIEVAQLWLDRLESIASRLSFRRSQVWLLSREGFSDEAAALMGQRRAFASSLSQIELINSQLGENQPTTPVEGTDEFVMIVPMGDENELIAASAVEQVARRLDFGSEANNQIKTAIVEACLNAAEHSFSPERKIYQRFRVESDKLVVTISSRGIVPTNVGTNGSITTKPEPDEGAEERRGRGLRLIRTLMDEVEFERVDEGTSLRMTKYLRSRSS
jgi:serine/threonine-protein kinase RsbW